MNRAKTLVKNYWNWRSKSYAHEYSTEIMNGKWDSILKDLVSDSPGRCALDLGTGTGLFAICLARAGFDVTAIDISEKMLLHAEQTTLSQGLNIHFQLGDAEDLNFEDHSFDVVVSRNLLWTLPDPVRALKEWWRVMKPGATLVVCDGFWMNYTWKRFHHFALQSLKRFIYNDNPTLPIRFFHRYAGLQNSLPFYEGIRFEEISMLLQDSGYKTIRRYDPLCFDVHPYSGQKKPKDSTPSFFIAYAQR